MKKFRTTISAVIVLLMVSVLYSAKAQAADSVVYSEALATSCIREKPDKSSRQIGSVKKGEKVIITGEETAGFMKVIHGDVEGYIFEGCLDAPESVQTINPAAEKITSAVAQKTPEQNTAPVAEVKALPVNNETAKAEIAKAETVKAEAAKAESVQNETVKDAAIQTEPVQASAVTNQPVQQSAIVLVPKESVAKTDITRVTVVPAVTSAPAASKGSAGIMLSFVGGSNDPKLIRAMAEAAYNNQKKEEADKARAKAVISEDPGLDPNARPFLCTGYCPCKICCGKYSPEVTGCEQHTATGTIPTEGRTIAVDPIVIPYGTEVYIEGLGTFVAEDCGGMIKGDRIDVYFASHEEALAFGKRTLYVSIDR